MPATKFLNNIPQWSCSGRLGKLEQVLRRRKIVHTMAPVVNTVPMLLLYFCIPDRTLGGKTGGPPIRTVNLTGRKFQLSLNIVPRLCSGRNLINGSLDDPHGGEIMKWLQ